MALVDEIIANLRGYSKAMYSTWFRFRPARILFDAGEGVSSAMENFVFALEAIFLSHGHYDHIGGIGGIIHSRASARGDKEKPLRICYPAGDPMIELLHEYLSRISDNVKYDLTWTPVRAGDEIPLGTERGRGTIRAFPVRHSARTASLGYAIFERRRRLRPELVGRPTEEIVRIVREQGRAAVTAEYEQILLAYCGDCSPVNPDLVPRAEVLMHEGTFIDAADRANEAHSTVAEALDVATAARVGHLVLFHISTRYHKRQVVPMIRKIALERRFDRGLTVVSGQRWMPVLGPGGEVLPPQDTEIRPGTGAGNAGTVR